MTDRSIVPDLEGQLNDRDPRVRMRALRRLEELVRDGSVLLPPEADVANMHCHTFHSYNGYGHSPTSLAWQAKRLGIRSMGIVDFDVLDGVEEFLTACDAVGVRGSTGIETRLFIPEFATREINSPGEPGVYYHMGIGFTSGDVPGRAADILADLRQRASERNQAMVVRINRSLQPVEVAYETDVLPLTPRGNATERHMVAAYIGAAERVFPQRTQKVRFWSQSLGADPADVEQQMYDAPGFANLVRAKLMKRGGVGYVKPGPDTFPGVDEFHEFVLACGAIPCAAWLDGLSEGEQALEELLALLIPKGVAAMNIVPDRNWNVPDPELRRKKVAKLYEAVQLAEELALPLNIGTEVNKFGQRMVDDFDAPELAPVRQAFLDGADFVTGHTVAQRALGIGYQSEWAHSCLPDRRKRNTFYMAIGRRVPAGNEGLRLLRALDPRLDPAAILAAL